MTQPKKLNTGLPRVATTDQVAGAMDRLVEREQQNRINKRFTLLTDSLQQQINSLPTGGGGGDGSDYDLSADESNFSLVNTEGNSWFLDIIPGGIGTVELADGAVTGDKLENLADSGTGTLLAITRDAKGRVSGTRATIPSDFPAPTINTQAGDFVAPEWDAGTSTLTANLRAKTFYSDVTTPVVDFIAKGDFGAFHFFVDTGASFNVQGISDGEEGAFFVIENDPSSLGDVVVENESGVFIANYVKTPDGTDYTVSPGNAVILRYVFDATYADPGYWVFYAATAAGGGGGGVASVVAGTGISVDNTDPANPVVSATSTAVVESVVAGAGITVDSTDPANPIVSALPASVVRTLGAVFDASPTEVSSASFQRVPVLVSGTISGWRIVGSSVGSAVFDILNNGVSIVAALPPTITGDDDVSSTTLTGWTTGVVAGDLLEFRVTSSLAFKNVLIALTLV